MAVVVKGDVADARFPEVGHGADHFAARLEVGMSGTEDAAQLAIAAEAPLRVPGVDTDALGAWLIETGLDDASGRRQRRQVAALIPGAARWPCHRGNDRELGVLADR